MSTHFERPFRRGESRGILPLVLAAIGGGRALLGGIQANQAKQRNKGYIDANYRLASDRLNTNQANTREATSELLNARGLSPVASAMMSGGAGAAPASTLGGQTQALQEHQLGLERQDLDNQHNYALRENQANYTGALVNSAVSGATTAMSAYGASQMSSGSAPAAATPGNSPIKSAMMSGGQTEAAQIGLGGADVIDPLGHPDSAWHPSNRGTVSAVGQTNDQFNTGSV
jgi:hypothetical protein